MARRSDSIGIKPQEKDNAIRDYKTFSKEQLQEYAEVQTWLKTIGESSKNYYLLSLQGFCTWCGKNPHELIMQRDKEIKSDKPSERNNTRDLITDYRKYLEKQGYAPKTINAMDGAIRGFYSAVLGRMGMINIRNYCSGNIPSKKDLVPTLEELKQMLDVVDLEEKFRIIFIAQTGMRISDAVKLKFGDIRREFDLGKIPLAIRFIPLKDGDVIGERVTFLGSDGVDILKQYLELRKKRGETLTDDSPLFTSRVGKGKYRSITQHNFNETIKKAGRRIGLINGDAKYGRIRIHCLRKFFITQMTNHGVEDKIINFLTCHKISDVDAVYWNRRVEELRRIYKERQQYLNPVNGDKKHYNLEEIKDIQAKIEDMDKRILSVEQIKELIAEVIEEKLSSFKQAMTRDTRIVSSENEIIELCRLGYSCTPWGNGRWLMQN
jgi:integrase/recombinase XerD